MTRALQTAFAAWLDNALAEKIPRRVVAFNFNLYEGEDSYHVDLIGAPSYNPRNSEWACTELFAAREPVFEIPRSSRIKTWRRAQSVALELIRSYLGRDHTNAQRLKNARAVTVGFVDGDLVRVWPTAS